MSEGLSKKAGFFERMFERCLESALIKYITIVSAAFAGGMLFSGFPALSGSTSASWVQAIGSVIAIVAAVCIADKQHRQNVALVQDEQQRIENQRIDEKRDDRKAIEKELELVFNALNALSSTSATGNVEVPLIDAAVREARKAKDQLTSISSALEKNVRIALGGRALIVTLTKIGNSGNWNDPPLAQTAGKWAESWMTEIQEALSKIGPELTT